MATKKPNKADLLTAGMNPITAATAQAVAETPKEPTTTRSRRRLDGTPRTRMVLFLSDEIADFAAVMADGEEISTSAYVERVLSEAAAAHRTQYEEYKALRDRMRKVKADADT